MYNGVWIAYFRRLSIKRALFYNEGRGYERCGHSFRRCAEQANNQNRVGQDWT